MIVTNAKYPAVFGEYFKTFGSEVHFNDVTLVSDDYKQFPAHRVILSAGSTVLRKLLLINSASPNPVLYLKGLRNEELRAVLQFLYLGETRVTEDRVQEFMKAAQELELKDFNTRDAAPGPPAASNIPVVSTANLSSLMEKKPHEQMQAMSKPKSLKRERTIMPAPVTPQSGGARTILPASVTLPPPQLMEEEGPDDDGLELDEMAAAGGEKPMDNSAMDQYINNQMVRYEENNEEPERKVPRQQIKCIICQDSFNDEATLAAHKKRAHKNVLFHCARCRFQTKDEAMFSQHMKADHSSSNGANQTYRCVLCEFQATKPDDLKVHLKTHNKRTVILNSATNSVEFQ